MAPLPLKQDDVVGKWKLSKSLGSGGQADVWKAYATEDHMAPAALKFCRHKDAKSRARFAQEIELLRSHAHASIVRFREAGDHRGTPYFVTELASTTLEGVVVGGTAGLRLLQESPAILIDFFRQACAGVAHLHASGVLHRDIKPSNILIFLDPPEPMRAVLADLGIGSFDAKQGNLTATLEAVGTPIYRAPEAASGPHTKSSDVYSLGKTLEYLFTRRTPPQLGPGKCLKDSRIAPPLWDALDAILWRACAIQPDQRYRDASELLQEIPSTVLTSATAQTVRTRPNQGELELHPDESRVLLQVIGACTTPTSSSAIWGLQSKSPLAASAFSLALHRLRFIKFVEVFDGESDRGDRYEAVRTTDAGLQWALSHRELLTEESVETGNDDDIPF